MPINKTKIVMLLVHFAFYVSFCGQRVSLKYKCKELEKLFKERLCPLT